MDPVNGEYLALKHARWLRPEKRSGKAVHPQEGDRVTIVVTGLVGPPRTIQDNRTGPGKGKYEPLIVLDPETYIVIDVEVDGAYVQRVEKPTR